MREKWLQVKGGPLVRPFLFHRLRVQSTHYIGYETLFEKLERVGTPEQGCPGKRPGSV